MNLTLKSKVKFWGVIFTTAQMCLQAKNLLDFDTSTPNHALMLNNLAFYDQMGVLEFLRDVGKYLTVNYMMSKESVRRRIESESGISFTEFSYQLLQGYDFVLLNRHHGITVQMGGSDQYGNITSGVELSRKIDDAKVYAVTTPLLTKADGTKFGKSEAGNIWLDARMTTPYKFYQFWIGADDRDVSRYLRFFTLLDREVIEALDESVRMDLAACDWRSGRVREAMDGYLDALQRRPENARAALNIGYLHFDALARTEAEKREHWPKARAAFLLFLQTVRPADGYDYFERSFAVPFRLKQIEELLGPAPSVAPTLADLR
jgi:hypothetical protein